MISTRARTRSGPLLLRGKRHGFGVLAVCIDFGIGVCENPRQQGF